MIKEKEFFGALIVGDYSCMPKALRSLFILTVNNQDKQELIVRRYTRPTAIEARCLL